MAPAKNLRTYRKELTQAINDDFLGKALDNFAVAYRQSRQNAFKGKNLDSWVERIAELKDDALGNLDHLFERFKEQAQAKGVKVHLAKTALDACRIIETIAEENKVSNIIKAKSMTAEEIGINHYLEANGYQYLGAKEYEVTETDLGEWIIQLRREGPSHMVMPAIHLSRGQVADLFTSVTGHPQPDNIDQLVKVARRQLRRKFMYADMGITGANFAIAQTGTIGLVTNEGNARLVTTLPKVHVALVGLEKLVSTLKDALDILRVLPRNATGQVLTSYVTWISGANECATAPSGRKEMHIVFLDNGRRALARDPEFSQVLRCVRCGACANVCPVYRMVGGHRYGHIYIGAIGLILTYFFHGRQNARNLVQNCINCGACRDVCAANIDLPRLIKAVDARIQDQQGHPLTNRVLAMVISQRKLFHSFLRSARMAQMPVSAGSPYLRHLPMIFDRAKNDRILPAVAPKPFRDLWPAFKKTVDRPQLKVALFGGCLQDFVYPEQLYAALKTLNRNKIAAEFPMGQSCCGLPLLMMGETTAAKKVARINIEAFDLDAVDYIITLCASCASHLKIGYPHMLGTTDQVTRFARKVMPFSAFLNQKLQLKTQKSSHTAKKVTFHSPCHLCRELKIIEDPHQLIMAAGHEFIPASEEQTCCGFGGTYSAKFPEISTKILSRKLEDVSRTNADVLVTECPGCVMQLRGGALKQEASFSVLHLAELLASSC